MGTEIDRPGRILVVDDNEAAAKILCLLLSLRGYETREAYGGKQAVEMASTFVPDVVFLDLGVPFMDGFEIARQIQIMPELKSTILVAVSGFKGEETIVRTRAAGFREFLAKPVDEEAIVALLSEYGFPARSSPRGLRLRESNAG